MSDELCPICKNRLHSIIIRRVGDVAVCRDCGDKLIPIVNGIAASFIKDCEIQCDDGLTPTEAIKDTYAQITSSDAITIPIEYAERIEVALNAR